MVGKRALVCEFVGARGVGKSTIAELVSKELRERQLACNRSEPWGLPTRLACQLGRYPNLIRALCTVDRLSPTSRRQLYKLADRYCGILQSGWRRFERHSDVVLLPVGVFQTIYMLHMHTAQKDMLAICRIVLTQVSAPDLVVFVEGSEQAIEERRRLRGEARDLRNPPQITPKEREALAGLRETLRRLAVGPAAPIEYLTVINNSRDNLAATAARIASTIVAQHHSRLYLGGARVALP